MQSKVCPQSIGGSPAHVFSYIGGVEGNYSLHQCNSNKQPSCNQQCSQRATPLGRVDEEADYLRVDQLQADTAKH